jgi:signal transduction histidine kinase
VRIEIEDTGIGIPPERIPDLFEPSFSKEGLRVKAGFGLLISRNIIQRHKGQIEVASECGKGSTFAITLPTDLREESKVPHAEETDIAASRCSRLDT